MAMAMEHSEVVEKQGLGPAMDYVQRIKTRFSHDPETYKQFLEILSNHKSNSHDVSPLLSTAIASTTILEKFLTSFPSSATRLRFIGRSRSCSRMRPILPPLSGSSCPCQEDRAVTK